MLYRVPIFRQQYAARTRGASYKMGDRARGAKPPSLRRGDTAATDRGISAVKSQAVRAPGDVSEIHARPNSVAFGTEHL